MALLSRASANNGTPASSLHRADQRYMVRERGLSQHTIRIRCWHLTQFLERFWEQHQALNEVTIADIDAAIARKGDRDGYARTSIQNYTNTLRALFRYAEQRFCGHTRLSAATMS